jgi:hypothetical protein
MSHDCDCSDCQETDSRWAYARRLKVAKEKDCPRGEHIVELWMSHPPPGQGKYRCPACDLWTDSSGKHQHIWRELTTDDVDGPRGCMCGAREPSEKPPTKTVEAPICYLHKRYQGKRQPRVNCADCWRRYIHLNPL